MRGLIVLFASLACLAFLSPSAPAGEKLLGQKIEEAKRTDFFTWFHLEQTGKDTDAQKHIVLTFKPTADKFRKLVTVQVVLDTEDHIQSIQLTLARTFIDDRMDGVFARDIAKSLLLSALPNAEQAKVKDLINEIQWGFEGKQTLLSGRDAPKLPDQPTEGYETFLGKRDSFEQDLGRAKMEIRQHKREKEGNAITIGIALKG